ncbi:MAG: YciI family protein [Firmicutes bacterium]|nr:YciI family protein [Bacillota bacterium]
MRDGHRQHLAAQGKKLLASGALLAEDGVTIVGGASLLDTDSREEAVRFEAEDPYAKAGIRREVRVIEWRLRWWLGDFDADGHRPSGKRNGKTES